MKAGRAAAAEAEAGVPGRASSGRPAAAMLERHHAARVLGSCLTHCSCSRPGCWALDGSGAAATAQQPRRDTRREPEVP